jgi:hypothetical protein
LDEARRYARGLGSAEGGGLKRELGHGVAEPGRFPRQPQQQADTPESDMIVVHTFGAEPYEITAAQMAGLRKGPESVNQSFEFGQGLMGLRRSR